MDVSEEKKDLRRLMKLRRGDMPLLDHRRKSTQIMDRCASLDEWSRSRTTHIYVSSVNNEVDTLGLIYGLFDSGVRVVVPRCVIGTSEMVPLEIGTLTELKPSRWCLMEPNYTADRVVGPDRLDLVVAPVLAFDRNGGRLGLGGGYYDRFLDQCECPKVGLAFAFQEVPEVPREPHDVLLDIVITEQEVIRIGRK